MDNQATISEIGNIFAKWCDLLAFAEGPHALDEAGFNALCDQMNQLERDARPIPATSPQDVWRKVVMLLDQPTEDQHDQEAILTRMARSALGLPVNRPTV